MIDNDFGCRFAGFAAASQVYPRFIELCDRRLCDREAIPAPNCGVRARRVRAAKPRRARTRPQFLNQRIQVHVCELEFDPNSSAKLDQSLLSNVRDYRDMRDLVERKHPVCHRATQSG
jgi:hypothetical protein